MPGGRADVPAAWFVRCIVRGVGEDGRMQRSGMGVLRWAWAGCLMAPCYNTVRSIPNTFVERSSTLVTGYRN